MQSIKLFSSATTSKRLILEVLISLFGVACGFALSYIGIIKCGLFLLSFSLLFIFINHPILLLVIAYSSGIFKDWLTEKTALFASIDFTVFIYSLTILILIFHFVRVGKIWQLKVPPGFISFSLLFLLMIFSLFYTASPKYGLLKTSSFFFFNGSLFIFSYLAITTREDINAFIKFFALLVGGVAVFALGNLIHGFLKGNLIFSYRASFLGINPISYANWIGAANIFFISLLFGRIDRTNKIFLGILVVILTAAMLVSNSRGPIASFVFSLAVLGLINIQHIKIKHLIQGGSAILLTIIVLFFILPEQVTSRYLDLFGGGSDVVSKVHSAYTINTRLFAWQTAVSAALSSVRSFFFGIGSGGFSSLFYGLDVRLYPHNMLIEVFCELGLVGLILLISHFYILFSLFFAKLKNIGGQDKFTFLGFVMAAIFLTFSAQFSGDLNDNRRIWFFLGLALASLEIYLKNAKNLYNDRYQTSNN
ncbi:MAG: O-antigen ligase family protein [candidate division KSB1 bacterium]|nr:O-antigen ligase family protein [candidate division KSB1 bacterium]